MSDVNKFSVNAPRDAQSKSFGAHRQSDLPASAVRAGATSMPAAWQTRGVRSSDDPRQHGAHVRSFVDIAGDPLRWATSTPLRRIASVIILCALFAIVI